MLTFILLSRYCYIFIYLYIDYIDYIILPIIISGASEGMKNLDYYKWYPPVSPPLRTTAYEYNIIVYSNWKLGHPKLFYHMLMTVFR